MRKVRVKEYVMKATHKYSENVLDYKQKECNNISVEQSQCDEAKFIQKYIDSVENK